MIAPRSVPTQRLPPVPPRTLAEGIVGAFVLLLLGAALCGAVLTVAAGIGAVPS
jgi:hypothetical protein